MQAKVQKLDVQFKEDIPKGPQDVDVPKIFEKVVIHINGYTVPPADELRRLVYLHGGRYQQYYTKRTVTHIIATNLPNSKIQELRDELVVHPSWILDSIKATRLLPVNEYLLYQGRKAAQKVLNFTSKLSSTCTTSKPSAGGVPSVSTSTLQSPQGGPKKDMSSTSIPSPTGGLSVSASVSTPGQKQFDDVNDARIVRNITENDSVCEDEEMLTENPTSVNESSKDRELLGNDEQGECNATLRATSTLEVTTLAKGTDNMLFKKPNTSTLPRAGDANFVSEFYNNSRLHYLSTWGAEFKKYTSDIIKSCAAKGWKGRGTGRVGPHGRVIMHIDMDSFFVSVTLRDQPQLRGKPIAVCHAGKSSSSADQASTSNQQTSPNKPSSFFNSMSEIASCSYEARAAGVRNGMFLGAARKLCPDIHCVPYQFEQYRQVSQRLYDILVTYSHEIEAVSCDEAYIDVSETLEEGETPTELAEKIRAEIKEATRCTASVGISSNILLARMCTRVAKPDGCYYLSPADDTNQFMGSQKVKDLPGVGWSLGHKLQTLGVETCTDLQKFSSQALQREFGPKTGLQLYQYCRGIDDRPLKTERERKSVSAEINYGIRFTKESEVELFINELAEEVQKRLQALDMKGRCITLKMKARKAGAPMPKKFMGHGICDNIARSCTLPTVTDEAQVIAKQCHALLKQLSVTPEDMRGMGIQVSKLTDKNASASTKNSRSLFDFMKPQTNGNESVTEPTDLEKEVGNTEENRERSVAESPKQEENKLPPLPRFSPQTAQQTGQSKSEKRLGDLGESLYLPSPSQIDPAVFEALPEDIRRSIEKSYAARNQRISLNRTGKQEEEAETPRPPQRKHTKYKQGKTASKSGSRTLFEENSLPEAAPSRTSELLPSPSQIDPEFLAALPDDVRQEIEQAYKQKDPHVTRAQVQPLPPVDSVSNAAAERRTERNTTTFQVADDQKKKSPQVIAPPKQARLGEAVTLSEVKKVVTEWTDAYEVPLEEDVEVFSDYLLQLIATKNLEQLWMVLKFLDRRIDGREDWKCVCCAVLAQVQQEISQKYCSKLSVKSLKFSNL
ncbi:DNA repair protein REV1-like isoform X2 [Oculina patagonica]